LIRVRRCIQRPLDRLAAAEGDFSAGDSGSRRSIRSALAVHAIARAGTRVRGGETLGTVQETAAIVHRVLVPPDCRGVITSIVPAGPHTVREVIASVKPSSSPPRESGNDAIEVRLAHRWRVRQPRPFRDRLSPTIPLLTGQRVLDTFFPLAQGSAAGMPGGFGTGKRSCSTSRADGRRPM
jgi:V/A-type H+-transporting ATPase subunit A